MKNLICLIGMPCSGKSSVAKLLAERIENSVLLSAGDIARSLSDATLWAQTEKVDLFPLEGDLRREISSRIDKAPEGSVILLEGFPRFGDQAQYMVKEFWHLIPRVIEVSTGDLHTNILRAQNRARDHRDTDPVALGRRLNLASKHMTEIYDVLNRSLVSYSTILSGPDEFIIKEFKRLHPEIKVR